MARTAELPGEAADRPLAGVRVAITADRRRDEQAALLGRMGAEIVAFPLLRTEPAARGVLRALTEQMAGDPPSYLVANTGYGMQSWLEAARDWGIRAALVEALRARTVIVARGAKALGALRKAGLDAAYKAPGETMREVVEWLLVRDLRGVPVAVQLHGEAPGPVLARLSIAGAGLIWLPVYTMSSAGRHAADDLVEALLGRRLDAVTFTAAPQVEALAAAAQEMGRLPEALAAFNSGMVVALCIGEVCAAAVREVGIVHPLVPEHPRLGSLARALGEHFAGKSQRT
jgi:uroporphyrinogen-III synthase